MLQILAVFLALVFSLSFAQGDPSIMTVLGKIPAKDLGDTLTHEHVLVGFPGDKGFDASRLEHDPIIAKALPFLRAAKTQGWSSFVECSPSNLLRDPLLLKKLSELSGLHILTNTGIYGGSNPSVLPANALNATDRQLADLWAAEFREGIGDTGIRPGFIKISVNAPNLSDISRKLLRAAALTHLDTGLVIMSHTGPGQAALEQITLLKEMGLSPDALIWTHAQAEKNESVMLNVAGEGAWIALDGVGPESVASYAAHLLLLKREGFLDRVLLSHDAGWYNPSLENGGSFRGYGTLRDSLIPVLKKEGFTDAEIDQLIRINPARAFAIGVRKSAAK